MDSRDKVIEELRVLLAKLAARIERQALQIDKLTSRIGELELQLANAKKDSTTSSKPPSSDTAKPKPNQSQNSAKGEPKSVAKGADLDMNTICECPSHQRESTKRLNTKSKKLSGCV